MGSTPSRPVRRQPPRQPAPPQPWYHYMFPPGWVVEDDCCSRDDPAPTSGTGGEPEVAPAPPEPATDPEVVNPPPAPAPKPPTPEKKPKVLKVTSVDYRTEENAEKHKTSEYDIVSIPEDGEVSQLVVRRGDSFVFDVQFNRKYDPKWDELKILMQISDHPKPSNGTYVPISPHKGLRQRHWSAAMTVKDENTVTMEIRLPGDCIIGKWRLCLVCMLPENERGQRDTHRYEHREPIYVIFNGWSKEDLVYLDDEDLLDEYVMNESGKIYSGNYKQIGYKTWNFGQFEDVVLDVAMFLLEKSDLAWHLRSSPIDITRRLSAMVNAQDDRGVLVGRWGKPYDDGTKPTAWTGSLGILREFWRTKEPVMYGQCWVFSGITTTVCRALGIPCRSVTNFASAHDTDGTTTIDKYVDHTGETINHSDLAYGLDNDDSVWNFHVWNEAWMARPDLDTGYGGWQAFDATPQELSDGIFCAGPAPVLAIKQGRVTLPYDTKFIFAEVNADRITWVRQLNGEFKPSVNKESVGKKVSTKKPRNGRAPDGAPRRNRWISVYDNASRDDPDRQDVTHEYKYAEGTQEERTAVMRAAQHGHFVAGFDLHDVESEDVKFEVLDRDGVYVGSLFEITLRVQNKSREKRTVAARMTLYACDQTGRRLGKIKYEQFSVELGPLQANEDCTITVEEPDYIDMIDSAVSFKIMISGHVEQTKQLHTHEEDYRLRRPDCDVVLADKSQIKKGDPFDVILKFTNPLHYSLTQGVWTIEGSGIKDVPHITQEEITPMSKVEKKVTLMAKKKGFHVLTASLDTKELEDIVGDLEIEIVQ